MYPGVMKVLFFFVPGNMTHHICTEQDGHAAPRKLAASRFNDSWLIDASWCLVQVENNRCVSVGPVPVQGVGGACV